MIPVTVNFILKVTLQTPVVMAIYGLKTRIFTLLTLMEYVIVLGPSFINMYKFKSLNLTGVILDIHDIRCPLLKMSLRHIAVFCKCFH